MVTKQEKAYDYSKRVSNSNPMVKNYVECAFMVGWDSAIKSQWVSIDERLPFIGEVVLALTSNGKISMAKMYQPKDCHGNDVGVVRWSGSSTFNNSIIAWMPIPSFDEILNNNKDVLKRLKDR